MCKQLLVEKIEKEKNGRTPVMKEAEKDTYKGDTKLKILPAIPESSIEVRKKNVQWKPVLWAFSIVREAISTYFL